MKYEEEGLRLSSAGPQTDPEEGHQDRGKDTTRVQGKGYVIPHLSPGGATAALGKR